MALTFEEGALITIPLTIIEKEDVVEDGTFTVKIFYDGNLTAIPDETYDWVTHNGTFINKIQTGLYEFRRTVDIAGGDPQGIWKIVFEYTQSTETFIVTENFRVGLVPSSATVVTNGTGSQVVTEADVGGPIVDPNNDPLGNADILIFAATDVDFTSILAQTKSNSNGEFTLFLDPGTYRMVIKLDRFKFDPKTFTVTP